MGGMTLMTYKVYANKIFQQNRSGSSKSEYRGPIYNLMFRKIRTVDDHLKINRRQKYYGKSQTHNPNYHKKTCY